MAGRHGPRWVLAALLCCGHSAEAIDGPVTIAAVPSGAQRFYTLVDEMARLHVGSLAPSPDGRRFAVFVRQADPANNRFRAGWFAGDMRGGALVPLGDGGEIGPRVMYTGHTPGEIEAREARWSPDGAWIAYRLRRNGETQLWRSRTDGGVQEQLTRNAGDVHEFAWSKDGKALYFSAGSSRADLSRQAQARAYSGYRYDEDLWMFTDFMAPQLIVPLETDLTVWVVSPGIHAERPASGTERESFERAKTAVAAAPDPAIAKVAQLPPLRDEKLRLCGTVSASHLLCVRENASTPDQVVAVDSRSGRVKVIADLNPQFRGLRLGKVERFEWDTPKFAWNEPGGKLAGLYVPRTYGYILYPPDFDPGKKYPVFIDPYVASGFSPLGAEHPLHVYAAQGFVVLRTNFPGFTAQAVREGKSGMKNMYSWELGFPHLTMLMESTVRGLDTAVARGFIDEKRVGIGGVSHGSFVPLFMMQKHDRIAAISISSPSWSGMQYYWGTRKARDTIAGMRKPDDDWFRNPQDEAGAAFHREFDIADHVDSLEAPILMQLAAQETYSSVRFIRNLADAGKPYDAYLFAGESHVKWQPAHLQAIAQRNLDWFRFWLQGVEEADPAKVEQYRKWRAMRDARSSD